jgi:hypothetical protein
MLDELKARITATVTNRTEDYRWDIFTAADGTLCKVFCLLTACLLYNLCVKKKLLVVDDYVVSTSVIISVFLRKLQIGVLFLEDPKYTYQHFREAYFPHHQSSPIWRSLLFSKMFIAMYQLAWHLVMEDWTLLQHLYEKLGSYKRNFLLSEFHKFLM